MHIYVYIHIYICILLYIYAYYLASSPRFSSTVCPNPPGTPSGRTSPYAPRPRCRTSSKSSGTNCGKLYHAAPTFQNHGFWAYLWIHTYLKIDIDICFLFSYLCVYMCVQVCIYIYRCICVCKDSWWFTMGLYMVKWNTFHNHKT